MYDTIKVILDRAAPLLIDKPCAKELVTLVTDSVNIDSQDDEDLDSDCSIGNDVTERKKFDLLMVRSVLRPFVRCKFKVVTQ